MSDRARSGQGLVEYAVGIALIAGLAIGMLIALGGTTGDIFSSIGSQITAIGGPAPSAGPSASPSPGDNLPPPVVGPPAPDPITQNPTYPLTCAGYTPYSSVTVILTIGSTSGPVATLIADVNGVASGDIPIPPDATPGTYSFRCQGPTTDGTRTSPPVTGDPVVDPNADAQLYANFTYLVGASIQASDVPTKQVSVNACSPAYRRTGPTMNSTGTLLAPGASMWVYSTPVEGGQWPRGGWSNPYTCDNNPYGAGTRWYRLTDGSGYIFIAGVSDTGPTDSAAGPAASAYDVAFTDTSGEGPITAWAWDLGDVGSASNTSTLQNPTHVYPGPGVYTVTITVTGPNGSDTYARPVSIPSLSGNAPQLFTSANAGSSWSSLEGVIGAAEVSATQAYALVDPDYASHFRYGYSFNASQVWKTTNSGANWAKVLDTDGVRLDGIAASDTAVYAYDSYGTSTLYTSTDGGVSWGQPATPDANANLTAVIPLTGSTVFVDEYDFSGQNAFYTSPDAGQTWTVTSTVPLKAFSKLLGMTNGNNELVPGTAENPLQQVVALNASDGIAVTTAWWYSSSPGTVYVTNDGGSTWTPAFGFSSINFSPSITSAGSGACVYGSDNGAGATVWCSPDAGASWNSVTLPAQITEQVFLSMGDASHLYAFGEDDLNNWSLYGSTDAGATWSQSALPFGARYTDYNILADGATAYATAFVGGWGPDATGMVYKTTNGGLSWSSVLTGQTGSILSLTPQGQATFGGGMSHQYGTPLLDPAHLYVISAPYVSGGG